MDKQKGEKYIELREDLEKLEKALNYSEDFCGRCWSEHLRESLYYRLPESLTEGIKNLIKFEIEKVENQIKDL